MNSEDTNDTIDLSEAKAGVRQTLEHLSRIGVSVLPVSDENQVQKLVDAWRTPEQASREVAVSNDARTQPEPTSASRSGQATSEPPAGSAAG